MRFRLRTLMLLVALVALACAAIKTNERISDRLRKYRNHDREAINYRRDLARIYPLAKPTERGIYQIVSSLEGARDREERAAAYWLRKAWRPWESAPRQE
jgi:hypothetical protein